MTAPAGYTTVTGSFITDATGSPLADGVIYFAPVDNLGNPVSFRVNGNGQAIVRRVSAPVVEGEFEIVLADTSLTSPLNVGYAVTVFDVASEDQLLGPGYECYQPSGAVADFDTFLPNTPAQATVNPLTVLSGSAAPTGPCTVPSLYYQGDNLFCCVAGSWVEVAGGVVSAATHDELLTDGNGNLIFANGDVITVVGVPN
jgi:hypothetical protein